MKIHGNKPPDKKDLPNILQTGKGKAAEKTGSSAKPAEKDMVNLSQSAREMSKLKALIEQLPEIRMDKIEAVKKEIESGAYHVDSIKLAEKIIEEL